MDTGNGSDEEIVVVDRDNIGNLANLVVEDPPCDFPGLVDGTIGIIALLYGSHRV